MALNKKYDLKMDWISFLPYIKRKQAKKCKKSMSKILGDYMVYVAILWGGGILWPLFKNKFLKFWHKTSKTMFFRFLK